METGNEVIETRQTKGGRARAAALSPEQRSESARKAVLARWAKERGAATVSVSVGQPQRAETQVVTFTILSQDQPQMTMEVGSHSVNSRSFVITANKQGGSSTQ